jgi:hypothetical protein
MQMNSNVIFLYKPQPNFKNKKNKWKKDIYRQKCYHKIVYNKIIANNIFCKIIKGKN